MNAPHTYLFGPPDQGCQCETCKRQRLNEAAPALAEALRKAHAALDAPYFTGSSAADGVVEAREIIGAALAEADL
jgi:hypothetical protein